MGGLLVTSLLNQRVILRVQDHGHAGVNRRHQLIRFSRHDAEGPEPTTGPFLPCIPEPAKAKGASSRIVNEYGCFVFRSSHFHL